MSLTARTLLRRARDRHPALTARSTPDSVLLDRLSTLQRELIQQGTAVRAGWLQQRLAIGLTNDPLNALGSVGAGGVGGLPAVESVNGDITADEATAGSLANIDTDRDPDFRGVPATITTDTLQFTGAGWTVDEWVDAYVVIVDGPGLGSTRLIVGNTADTLTLDAAVDAETAWSQGSPSALSVFAIYASEPNVPESQGVVTSFPSHRQRSGYLVKLDAQGNPYLDPTEPVMMHVTAGVPLPPNAGIGSQGSVFFLDDSAPVPLNIGNAAQRYSFATRFGAVIDGETLVLCGVTADWANVRNIEVPYTPVPPDLADLDDLLLLPDACEPMLVALLATFAASRSLGRGVTPEEFGLLQTQAQGASQVFLATLAGAGRARKRTVREVW